MSNKKNDNSFASKFKIWFSGVKDPYIGNLEMKPQKNPEQEELRRLRDIQREERTQQVSSELILKKYSKPYIAASILLCVAIIAILIYSIAFLPAIGEKSNPTNNEVSQVYIEEGLQDTGAVNIVAGMILTYRAFDTFGETTVLFIATCCVMIMLLIEKEDKRLAMKLDDFGQEPGEDLILQKIAKIVCPFIFLLGIYVILNGHLSPGGGFSGGAIIGAGLILYAVAFGFNKTQRFFNEKIYTIIKVSALMAYGLIAIYFFFTGANGLPSIFPHGIPGRILSGGIIMPINVCVGTEVACTIYAFYALFRRSEI